MEAKREMQAREAQTGEMQAREAQTGEMQERESQIGEMQERESQDKKIHTGDMQRRGLVHIYHGDGKGKTTCGIGLCCRAAGAGLKVVIYQFMKDTACNERKILEAVPNVIYANHEEKVRFSFRMTDEERGQEKERYLREFLSAAELAKETQADVFFLDEVLYAIGAGLFDENVLTAFLDKKPEKLEVILTGRSPSQELLDRADYVTELCKIKHPYDQAITAREGIEY